jgi:hypothetical protein
LLVAVALAGIATGATAAAPPTGVVVADIPPDYLAAYVNAARMTHLDWAIWSLQVRCSSPGAT